MPIIKPLSDLRNHFNQISEICHTQKEPVFITKKGIGDLVVMSLALYEQQRSLLELYQKLSEAAYQSQLGLQTIPLDEAMQKLEKKLDD